MRVRGAEGRGGDVDGVMELVECVGNEKFQAMCNVSVACRHAARAVTTKALIALAGHGYGSGAPPEDRH